MRSMLTTAWERANGAVGQGYVPSISNVDAYLQKKRTFFISFCFFFFCCTDIDALARGSRPNRASK